MTHPVAFGFVFWGFVFLATQAPAETTATEWIQYGSHAIAEVRIITEGQDCPQIAVNGQNVLLQNRAPATKEFPTICSASLPVDDQPDIVTLQRPDDPAHPILLPTTTHPRRIVVIGDGGCRIKGGVVQDCKNSETWPFAAIAAAAAKQKPDLVIHVGDYPSREQKCPEGQRSCVGEPYGDTWAAWSADFFEPARPLLETAPFVFVRGNHEECRRNGKGFMRLLAPGPFDPSVACESHLPAYAIPLAGLNLVVMDDSSASDIDVDEKLAAQYRTELAALKDAPAPGWLLMHRPIFGAVSGPLGVPIGGNATLIAGLPEGRWSDSTRLLLSGHIHSLEVLNYGPENRLPPQLIAGIGGDLLSQTPVILKGTIFQGYSGVRVADGFSLNQFGFVLMTRLDDGPAAELWRIDIFNTKGEIVRICQLSHGRIDCPPQH